VDNLLNPASIGPLLSIADAVAALDGEFVVFGGSPRFLTDWRWYKAIGSESDRFNDLALADYWANVHNLLDYRELRPPRDPIENRRLYDACAALRGAVHEFESERNRDILAAIDGGLDTIAASVRSFSAATADAIAGLTAVLRRPPFDGGTLAMNSGFGAWFGRGQQYVSFSRRSEAKGAWTNDRRDV
jgi:hypothetical protein